MSIFLLCSIIIFGHTTISNNFLTNFKRFYDNNICTNNETIFNEKYQYKEPRILRKRESKFDLNINSSSSTNRHSNTNSYTYLGCYLDDYPKRDVASKRIFSPNLTNTLCAAKCGRQGYPYSATQWSTECFCGHSYGAFGTHFQPRRYSTLMANHSGKKPIISHISACRMPCPGNQDEYCGGNNANSVYYTNLETKYDYLGCYIDLPNISPDFSKMGTLERPYSMSVTMCSFHCSAKGFPYFALNSGVYCYCGFNYGHYSKFLNNHDDACSYVCPGNASQFCGGFDNSSNAVYSTDLLLSNSSYSIYNFGDHWISILVKLGAGSYGSMERKLIERNRILNISLFNNSHTTYIITFKMYYLKSTLIKSPHIKSKDIVRGNFKTFTYNFRNDTYNLNLTALQHATRYKILLVASWGNDIKQRFIGVSRIIKTCNQGSQPNFEIFNFTTGIKGELFSSLNISFNVGKNVTFNRQQKYVLYYRFLNHAFCPPVDINDIILNTASADILGKSMIINNQSYAIIHNLIPSALYFIKVFYKGDNCGVHKQVVTSCSHPTKYPSNISIDLRTIAYDNFIITWDKPKCQDLFSQKFSYRVLINQNNSEKYIVYECSNCSMIRISKLHPNNMYIVRAQYYNKKGNGPFSPIILITLPPKIYNRIGLTFILTILLMILTTLILIIIIYRKYKFIKACLGKCSNRKYFHNNYINTLVQIKSNPSNDYVKSSRNKVSEVYEKVQKLYCDIPWQAIQISDTVLGEGQFSQVRKATVLIKDNWISVALKIIDKELVERDSFLSELEVMGKIGFHMNIVNLIGACIHEGIYFVALEYLEMGSLREYLRKNRYLNKQTGSLKLHNVNNLQLIQFALDVANGMSHLSLHHIIHRDLAARNILVSSHLVCKVGDFGLSKEENIYIKHSPDHLPWRWMSIESLKNDIYTTKSDVWSFGILLWEIITLGGTPYWPMDIQNHNQLLEILENSYRMPQPKYCNNEIYLLMKKCWNRDPAIRPSFLKIVHLIKNIIFNYHSYSKIKDVVYPNKENHGTKNKSFNNGINSDLGLMPKFITLNANYNDEEIDIKMANRQKIKSLKQKHFVSDSENSSIEIDYQNTSKGLLNLYRKQCKFNL
ncbi:unnamed protein product [Gordionus sp. m RMFG-2023]